MSQKTLLRGVPTKRTLVALTQSLSHVGLMRRLPAYIVRGSTQLTPRGQKSGQE